MLYEVITIPTVAPYLLPEIIKALAERYPGLDLRPREAVTQKLIEDLGEGRLDAAIVALPISEPALREVALFDEEFVLVRPVADADKPVPSAEMLREMQLRITSYNVCYTKLLRDQRHTNAGPDHLHQGRERTSLHQCTGRRRGRITSYNVCYTKLLRGSRRAG